jgi:undecaprenyl-diphosphatase
MAGRVQRLPWQVTAAVWLLLAFVLLTVEVLRQRGDVVAFDLWVHEHAPAALTMIPRGAVALVVDLGLRGAISGAALAYAAWLSLRVRSWRPFLVMVAALLALNGVVAALKLSFGRLAPNQGGPWMFAGGTEYPSGHVSNSVVTWGTALWLQQRYDLRRLSPVAARATLFAIAGAVGLGTLLLDTHWLSDVLAGWAVGALLLFTLPLTDRIPRLPPWLVERRLAADHPVRTGRNAAKAGGARRAAPSREAGSRRGGRRPPGRPSTLRQGCRWT